ncbi:hypothetical protein [uncultured Desulfovibrio sp.]|uniref:hypothetical protein n=1 Tax=uncultured Desulfovibrio sp. TaxID=167968 RepID=UPI0026143CF9|nr:hypothetical protein [uncultured Desulfovibrio sp.]
MPGNPGTPANGGRIVINLPTPMFQAVGGQLYKLLLETTAEQVRMTDGVSVETRVNTLERALAANTTTRFADTIAARDALTGMIPGDRVFVVDATGDATVASGSATYIWMPDFTWRKLSEDESIDMLSWENLDGKPQSTVADIDLAVARQHAHANKTELDVLSDDGTGNLLYRGKRINDGKVDVASTTDVGIIPDNLRDGGLLIVNPAGTP